MHNDTITLPQTTCTPYTHTHCLSHSSTHMYVLVCTHPGAPQGQISELASSTQGDHFLEGELQSSESTWFTISLAAAELGIKLESPNTGLGDAPVAGRAGPGF